MSKLQQWQLTRLAELGLTPYDFDNELVVREQLLAELEDMADEHERFSSVAGSLHNSSFTDAEWEELT